MTCIKIKLERIFSSSRLKERDGNILTSDESVLRRWKE